ncbi:RuBisCO-cytochrome methylase, RMS1 [Cynara cardunculus var. scolymus]|uniref:N-lysine methyltransferase n=1 Tax=Cynara cardunculus var. scolymus TaxID=59895 RepID=A0A103YFH9_CYNCS|nr:RuBisCO-cytochrome methylase, RMS1 [Cynara cardunculus var. scolymus]
MASTRRMRAFKRWMKCQSIEYSDALDLVIQQEDLQIWVKALCDLHDGDLIATIPKHSCLTVKSSAACPLIQDFCLEGYMALSVALMYEKSLGQRSPWFGYLQLLPDCNPEVPLLWSIDEIDQLLLGTELHKVSFHLFVEILRVYLNLILIRNPFVHLKSLIDPSCHSDSSPQFLITWYMYRQTVKEDKALVYKDWKACIVPFVESAPIKLDPNDFGVEQYFAAKSLISSRSFQIDEHYGFGMVPLADLFNHKTDAEDVHFTSVSSHSESDDDTDENMENQVDNDLDGDLLRQNESDIASPKRSFSADGACSPTTEILEMILVRDVKAGAEVFNTYGSMGNAALLHRYGFTEPDNPYDIVNIDLELVLQWSSSQFSSRYTRSRLSLWRRLYHPELSSLQTEYFEISYDGEPEVELLKLIFIMLLPEKTYNEFYLAVSTAQNSDKSITVISNKERIILGEVSEWNKKVLLTEGVRGALLSLADSREICYGLRSMEEDVEALEKCPVREKKLHHSLVLRISERRILEKLRTYASAKK